LRLNQPGIDQATDGPLDDWSGDLINPAHPTIGCDKSS
jgi:hypothetical protein